MSKIQEFTLPRLGDKVFRMVLPNGYTVYAAPMPGKRTVHAQFGAGIGSIHRSLTLDGRNVSVPAGTAHFLEHKLFESSEGGNAFQLFSETGANANAFTSYERTVYLFDTATHPEKALDTLLRFVTAPHFTDETVQKEMGIIAEEIRMYDDNPDWALSEGLLQCLYPTHPVRDDIAGSEQTIAQITAETLYDCYRGFYRPENMALCVAGGMDPEVVFETANNILGSMQPPNGEVLTPLPQETDARLAAKESRRSMAVFSPQFALGFREDPIPRDGNYLRHATKLKLLMELIAGECSPLYRRLYDDGLVNETFDAGDLSVGGALAISFSGESPDAARTVDEIRKEIARVKREGIDSERFEEVRRAYLGRQLTDFDSPGAVASKLTICHFHNQPLCDIIECDIRKHELDELVQGMFNDEKSAVAYIDPQ